MSDNEKVETAITIPSDPAVKAAILAGIKEISNQWTIMEGYRAAVKEAVEALAEKHELPKKYIRKLARTYHNQNFEHQQEENEEFGILYEAIIAAKDKEVTTNG